MARSRADLFLGHYGVPPLEWRDSKTAPGSSIAGAGWELAEGRSAFPALSC